MPRFTDEEVRRYARQLVLAEVGGIGQERLRAASAAAESEVEALYLAAAGVGRLTVPAEAIARAVRELNPAVEVSVAPGPESPVSVAAAAARALATLAQVLRL